MSENRKRPEKPIDLTKGVLNVMNQIDTNKDKVPQLITVLPDVNVLKQIVTEPVVPGMQNNVNVMLNSNFVADISGKVHSTVRAISKELKDPAQKEIVRSIINETESITNEAKQLADESEKATTEEDVGDGIAEFVLAASDSQIAAAELREIGKELNKDDATNTEKIIAIVDSIVTKAERMEKTPGKIKKVALDFLDTIREFKQYIFGTIKGLKIRITGSFKENLTLLLRKVADLLQQFFTKLISSFFALASWVNKLALSKQFHMNELTLDIPSFESSIFMVGPFPIPAPKLSTPKLIAKFIPKP